MKIIFITFIYKINITYIILIVINKLPKKKTKQKTRNLQENKTKI